MCRPPSCPIRSSTWAEKEGSIREDLRGPVVSANGRASTRSGGNILLVDDQPEGLRALEMAIDGLGERIVTAGSGQEALKAALSLDFAVILLDVRMPDMDGFETARYLRLRPQTRHTPIIFVTA